MNILRILSTVCGLAIATSACVASPTAADGHTVGSGNVRQASSRTADVSRSGRAGGTASDAAAFSVQGVPAVDSALARTGHTVGSGN